MKKFTRIAISVLMASLLLTSCASLPNLTGPIELPSLSYPTVVANPTATPTPPPPQIAPQVVKAMFNKLLESIPATDGYGYLSADDFKSEISSGSKPFIIDVRDPNEISQKGYIQGAVNIPIRVLLRDLNLLPSQQSKILIYSNLGNRSGMAIAVLKLLGYTDVHDLAGGFSSWVHVSNYPVVTGSMPPAPQVLTPTPVISDQATYEMLDSFLTHLPDDYYQVDPITVYHQLSTKTPPVLVDMNLPSDDQEYGYVKGSVHIEFLDFFNHLDMLPSKDTPIVIYAVGGGHSAILVMGLREMGYTQVYSMKGGIIGWDNAGLPAQLGSGD